jgi:hypothetical protein
MLSEKRNMEAAQRFFKQAVAVVGHTPDRSRPMDTVPIHEQYARQSATMSSIIPINTSTIIWNKITEALNSDTILCADLDHLRRQHVFVVRLTNYGIISVHAPSWEK